MSTSTQAPGGPSFDPYRASSMGLESKEAERSGSSGRARPALGSQDTLRSAQNDAREHSAQESSCLSCIGSFFVSCWDVIASFFTSLFSCFCSGAEGAKPPSAERVALDAFLATEKPAREAALAALQEFVSDTRTIFNEQGSEPAIRSENNRGWRLALNLNNSVPSAALDYALGQFRAAIDDRGLTDADWQPPAEGVRDYKQQLFARMTLQREYNNVLGWLGEWADREEQAIAERERELVLVEAAAPLRGFYFNAIKPVIDEFYDKVDWSMSPEKRLPGIKAGITKLLKSAPESIRKEIYESALADWRTWYRDPDYAPEEYKDRNGQIDHVKLFNRRVFEQGDTRFVLSYLKEFEATRIPASFTQEWEDRHTAEESKA